MDPSLPLATVQRDEGCLPHSTLEMAELSEGGWGMSALGEGTWWDVG